MNDTSDQSKAKNDFSLILRKRLKTELDYQSLTAAELARRTSVPKQVISDWLAGVMPRRLDHLKRVASELSLTIDELCFGQSEVMRSTGDRPSDDGIVGRYEIVVQRIK